MSLDAQELSSFLAIETKEELIVDRSAHGDLLRINFNISFPSLSCEFATLDVSDALGTVRSFLGSIIFVESGLLTCSSLTEFPCCTLLLPARSMEMMRKQAQTHPCQEVICQQHAKHPSAA